MQSNANKRVNQKENGPEHRQLHRGQESEWVCADCCLAGTHHKVRAKCCEAGSLSGNKSERGEANDRGPSRPLSAFPLKHFYWFLEANMSGTHVAAKVNAFYSYYSTNSYYSATACNTDLQFSSFSWGFGKVVFHIRIEKMIVHIYTSTQGTVGLRF